MVRIANDDEGQRMKDQDFAGLNWRGASIRLVVSSLMAVARTNLQRDGRLPHFLMAIADAADAVCPVDELPPSAWPIAADLLKGTPGWRWLAHVSEAWTKVQPLNEAPRLPSECEDRAEAILVEVCSPDGDLLCCIQPIDRDPNGGPVFTRSAYFLRPQESRVLGFSSSTLPEEIDGISSSTLRGEVDGKVHH